MASRETFIHSNPQPDQGGQSNVSQAGKLVPLPQIGKGLSQRRLADPRVKRCGGSEILQQANQAANYAGKHPSPCRRISPALRK